MTGRVYDAIVVGARCAGAPTAMLLARKGYDVLAVDRVHFPSDTVSTHLIHAPGVAALRRWGLLDRVAATGCPPIDTYSFDFGPIRLQGNPARRARSVAYCPRRTVLDALLVDAAREAGAEVREGFTFDELLVDDGNSVTGIRGTHAGTTVTERARIVIGADGARSRVANAVACSLLPRTADAGGCLLLLLERHTRHRRASGHCGPATASAPSPPTTGSPCCSRRGRTQSSAT